MWILPLVGYLGVILGFSFLTLAIGMQSSIETVYHKLRACADVEMNGI